MSILPLNLIKGTRSVLYEQLENTEDMEEVEQHIEKLKAKVCGQLVVGVCHMSSVSGSMYVGALSLFLLSYDIYKSM